MVGGGVGAADESSLVGLSERRWRYSGVGG